MIKTFFNWLILSSTDENKLSATLKGSIVFAMAVAVSRIFNIDISEALTSLVALIVGVVKVSGEAYAVYGALRKVYLTWKGRNAVLNSPAL